MPRKKNTNDTPAADAAAPQDGTAADATVPTGPMVTIVKTATAAKLSPRGDGELTYQVGRMGDTVLLRIHKNDSSGRFSNEWVGTDALRNSLAQLPKGVISFKGAVALKSAWKGQSSCNSGFGAAILRAEGVFAADPDPKKKGLLRLASPEALEQWERGILALPVPKHSEQVLLNPPKAKPFFAKKKEGDADAANAAPDAEQVEPVESGEPVDADGTTADDAA